MQKIVFSDPVGWAGMISFGAYMFPEFRKDMNLIPLMSINGENDGVFRPMRNAESYFHIIQNSPNHTKAFFDHPVIFLERMNHGSVLNSQLSRVNIFEQDLPSVLPKSIAHAKISKLLSAFMEREISHEAAAIIFQNALESEERLKPMVLLLEIEANTRLKRPCNSDNPSPHCPFYSMYPVVN